MANTKIAQAEEASSFSTHALAPVQRETLEYLRSFISDKGYAPTLKDISQYIGVRSPSTAHFHLSRLEDKGFIRRGPDGALELVDREELQVTAGPCAVPLVGLIAAGAPIEAIEDRTVTVDIPPQFLSKQSYSAKGSVGNSGGGLKHGEIYCLQVTGDSMIDAHIMDGDIVIIRRQDSADDGQIVVALLEDNTATLKTFRRLKGGKVLLVPRNPNHQPIAVDKVTIQGRMIGLVREL